MNISFKNQEECDAIMSILGYYEKKRDKDNLVESADNYDIIEKIKSEVDQFELKNSFDFIGPIHCHNCRNTWTVTVSIFTNKVECPGCKSAITIPDEKFAKSDKI